jgi:hypothetical protein
MPVARSACSARTSSPSDHAAPAPTARDEAPMPLLSAGLWLPSAVIACSCDNDLDTGDSLRQLAGEFLRATSKPNC